MSDIVPSIDIKLLVRLKDPVVIPALVNFYRHSFRFTSYIKIVCMSAYIPHTNLYVYINFNKIYKCSLQSGTNTRLPPLEVGVGEWCKF